ncbi:MAG TPA: RsmE family RNA methyltransferase [Tepidisphaeraceae bacterium]|jgi:16S rRNA (uracil1498-N3)-methyltransferase
MTDHHQGTPNPPPVPSAPSKHSENSTSRSLASPGDEPLSTSLTLTLDQPFRFDRGLAKRLRLREINPTEAFTLRDATGAYFRASIKEYNAKGGLALPYERMARSPESTIDITLACAILARHRMHLVMQKATELGVRRIVPLFTDHSVPSTALDQQQPHAWPSHIARATRQCRRSSVPHLLSPATLDEFLKSPLLAATDLKLFLDDQSNPSPAPHKIPKRIILFTGPEGGFSDPERQRLASQAHPYVLGGRVLRAETAAIAGLTALHVTWGDFRPT